MFLPPEFLYLGLLQSLLLLLHLTFQLILLGLLVHELIKPLFVLGAYELGLLGLFFLVEHDGILYFSLFSLSLFPHAGDAVAGFLLSHGLHLLFLHFFMNFFVVFLL